jgi:hypothetical protein
MCKPCIVTRQAGGGVDTRTVVAHEGQIPIMPGQPGEFRIRQVLRYARSRPEPGELVS